MNKGISSTQNSGFDNAIEYIGGKWKLQIIRSLKDGPLRFTALKDALSPITQKMLATALKELEVDGLVRREVFSVVPPKVEYSLTPLFGNLNEALEIIAHWGATLPPKGDAKITIATESSSIAEVQSAQEAEITHTKTDVIINAVEETTPGSQDELHQPEEQPHKHESYLKRNDKPSRISNLFK